jgi:hypothetical protein
MLPRQFRVAGIQNKGCATNGWGQRRKRRASALALSGVMQPNIFMLDFERTEWSDGHFSMLGRALAIATRFEASVRSLALLVDVKAAPEALESDELIDGLVEAAWKRRLFKDLKHLGLDKGGAADILKAARHARNRIAHEITLGLDRCLDLLPATAVPGLEQEVRALAQALAKGDRIVCALETIATNEHMPSPEFFDSYLDRIEQWVCDT